MHAGRWHAGRWLVPAALRLVLVLRLVRPPRRRSPVGAVLSGRAPAYAEPPTRPGLGNLCSTVCGRANLYGPTSIARGVCASCVKITDPKEKTL